jgi:hypothetical protein
MALADGLVRNERALIMDTSISRTGQTPCELAKIMEVFDAAHDIVSSTFVKLTASIHAEMDPEE